MSTRATVLRWAVLAVALAFLNLSLTFTNIWPTLGVRMTSALSAEAALVVLALALARQRFGPPAARTLRWLGIVWVVLLAGRYADVTTRSLYGREINLYWDTRYMPDVAAMLAFVADPLHIAGLIAGVVLVPLLLYAIVRWALGAVSDATSDPQARRGLAALGAIVLACGLAQLAGVPVPGMPAIAEPVSPAYFRQARLFAYELSGAGVRTLPPAVPMASNLARVQGADVYLVFIESYGVVSWDRPEFAAALAPARAQLEADIRGTGRRVASARVESTTFGGESWLAHISLMSGTEVRDQDTNVRLMGQQRDTLATVFARQGYRTIAVMPGMQRAWPEGRFYGFNQIIGATELAYRGPPFGWWDVTDQYALARLDALAGVQREPLFVFFPTISTHTPFTPTPPYQPDWGRILTETPYDQDELDRAWAEPPDWLNLGPGYAQAVNYIYATLGGYMRLHAGRDAILILIGDHQPPAAVSGEGASWDVPVHIVASRPAVLDRLFEEGFVEGLAPPDRTAMKIHALLPVLLDVFGDQTTAAQTARSVPDQRTATAGSGVVSSQAR